MVMITNCLHFFCYKILLQNRKQSSQKIIRVILSFCSYMQFMFPVFIIVKSGIHKLQLCINLLDHHPM